MLEKEREFHLMYIIGKVTGIMYAFAICAGVGYQLMPLKNDDGFFYWYVEHRRDHQFFKTRDECMIQFLFYWREWKKEPQLKLQS